MPFSGEVETELRKTNFSRNRFAYLAQFLVLTLSIWYQTDFQTPYWPYTIAMALVGVILRFLGSEVIRSQNRAQFVLSGGFFLLGLAWAHHFYRNVDPATAITAKEFYLLFAIAGTIYVLQLTLVADLLSYFSFIAPIAVTVLVLYFRESTRTGSSAASSKAA